MYENLGAVEKAQGWGVAYNAGVAAVIGGTVSTLSGGSFEDAALNAAMGRLFNDLAHPGIAAIPELSLIGRAIGDFFAIPARAVTYIGQAFAGAASTTAVVAVGLLYSESTGAGADGHWSMYKADEKEIKAPGIPTEADGFVPTKKWDGSSKVRAENGRGYGYPAKDGSIWVPTGEGPLAHGGPHWDVQLPSGKHKNVYPGGKIR